MASSIRAASLLVIAGLAAACAAETPGADVSGTAPAPRMAQSANQASDASAAPSVRTQDTVPANLPAMVVHKTATCGCCKLWVEHMQAAGFPVDVRDVTDLNPIKEEVGVPPGKGSCHTAQVGRYFIEGHVPADDVKRLLAEQPDALGLALPGMPAGSRGLEIPDGRIDPFTVELVHADGTTSPFSDHGHL